MLARRSSIKHGCVGLLAPFLFICLVIVVRNVTASDQEPPPLVPTATPAGMPERTDVPVGPAPLVLTKSASTTTVIPGQSFTYTLHVTTSRDQARVEVRDMPDPGIEIVPSMVICTVQAGASKPAVITIVVRARNDVAPNTWLIGQALAQDDLNFTAASERVAVQVVAPPPVISAPIPGCQCIARQCISTCRKDARSAGCAGTPCSYTQRDENGAVHCSPITNCGSTIVITRRSCIIGRR